MILDEAQNTTIDQMKMFLTRMGNNSKMIINGDVTQIDLEQMEDSGLLDARVMFRDVEGIGWIEMDSSDIRRHQMVQKIVEAYEAREADLKM
jgi:phosphate starvation-inducible PhoH-like protein